MLTILTPSGSFTRIAAFAAGIIVAGIGIGAAFQGAVRNVMPLAAPHERAAVFAVILVLVYLSMGIPAVVAGFVVSQGAELSRTAFELGAAVLLMIVVALVGALASRPVSTPKAA